MWAETAELPARLMMDWSDAKLLFEHSLAFSNDAIHVMVGVVIQLAAAWLLGVSVARFAPWAIVFLCELLNEAIDLTVETWPSFAMQAGESGKDILLTMAIPTLLFIIARIRPQILAPSRYARPDEAPDITENSAKSLNDRAR